MKEFRHLLFMETGGHNWKKIKSKFKFTDPKGNEYVVVKCKKCGVTGQRYIFPDRDKKGKDKALKSIYIGPQYLRKHVMKCPEEMGLFDYVDPEKEETVAVLGGGEAAPKITRKKKKKKGKKDKKKKSQKVKGYIRIKNVKSFDPPKKRKKIKRIKRNKS